MINYTVYAVRKSLAQFKVGCFIADSYDTALNVAFKVVRQDPEKYAPEEDLFGLYGVSAYMGSQMHGQIATVKRLCKAS